jgi:uncharacterized protein YecE (DUF72 family)
MDARSGLSGLSYDKQKVSDFPDVLREYNSDYRFAIEIRHKSWLTDSFFDLLSKHGIAFVIADSGKRFPYHETVTADHVYLRFHGPERLYASEYRDHELKR